ncbi:MAG TPA: polyhydroxyalkanoate synthesis regulator DNA-binding domain-containing protein [Kofleriaceae bacterium]|nr:polyhydroxyalkanoate synthesis regulator DNA-binding domain-containing protein [Kofleriaceae bacterium]
MAAILIKKYGNRRLYDTAESRYITLDELSDKIRGGQDVRVVDAKTNEDLTQPTLTQIIIESRGAARLLPPQLLMQLIRLGDDALAEFFNRWVTNALDVYLQAKRGAQTVAAFNPFASMPFAWNPYASPAPAPAPPTPTDDVAELRREIEELKKSVRKRR